MKKILCLIENLSQGGAERQMIGLAAMLKDKGYSIKIITYHSNNFYKFLLDDKNVDMEYIPKAQNKILRIPVLCKAIASYKPDVVISYLRTPCIIACIAKIILGKFKLIVSERNTTQKLTLSEKIKFFLYRFSDYIIPNSYAQANYIKKRYPHLGSKIRTITNFVDTNFFHPNPSKQNHSVLKIICVGRVEPQKNILVFIEAVKMILDKGFQIEINWFGDNQLSQSYYNECSNLIKDLKIDQHFKFHDADKNIRERYWEHDILCLPSIYEGYPNVVCEAMSSGLPIVCSHISDTPLIVRDTVNGFLFNPEKPENISNAIIKYCKLGKEERTNFSRQSRLFAENDFSEKKFIEEYLTVIND